MAGITRILKKLFRTGGKRYAFVFICQEGELEIKALLLAASLKRFLRCDYELVAALPAPEETWGRPGAATLALLARMGVRTVPVVNEIDPPYPLANKIACLKIRSDAAKLVFIDSDILCMREFRDEPRFAADLNAKPADLQTFTSSEDVWRVAYNAAGVPMPSERVASTFSGEPGPPYFNSGFIALNNGIPLSDAWVECTRIMNRIETLPRQERWDDQPSLPVAIHKLKLRYDLLDEQYNFPAHLRRLDANQPPPFFCHYHYPHVIEREPQLIKLTGELVAAHPEIGALMRNHEGWRALA